MTIEKIHAITRVLDLAGKSEHIFFMSKNEYAKEFNFLFQQYPKNDTTICSFLTKEDAEKYLIASIFIDGITFYVLDSNKL